MSLKDYIDISIGVVTNPYVIITVVVMILVIQFAKFVASYKKRPARKKVKKGAKKPSPVIVSKPKEDSGDENSNNEDNKDTKTE